MASYASEPRIPLATSMDSNVPETQEQPAIPWWTMWLVALAVGVVAGFGAVVFRGMIGGFHNLLFLGRWSFAYDTNVHTPASPWGAGIILVPLLGALIVAFLVKTFAPEAKGHGVPEVMSAVYYHDGKIRPVVALVKALASAVSIGSGGSVGREGPIIQIGAAFGSTLGQIIAMPVRQRAILIAAGAGGGIAATFNTPIGGILFAVELMLACVSPKSVMCVAISCVTATAIGRRFLGMLPAFNVPSLVAFQGSTEPLTLLVCVLALGVMIGLVACLTTRGIYWFEDRFDALPGNYYTRHMTGMLLVGLMFWGAMSFSDTLFGQPDHYYLQGVGYATILDVLDGGLTATGFLVALGLAKLLATCLTLGSGASGGIFSPCMFIGATLGAASAHALGWLFPGIAVNPVHFALAGMAAMVGSTTGATMTAIIMMFEMTRDYAVILPVVLAVATASAVHRWLLPSTIYTLKLLRRGEVVPQGLVAWRGELRARHVMSTRFVLLDEGAARDERLVADSLARGLVVLERGTDGNVRRLLEKHGPGGASLQRRLAVQVNEGVSLHEVLRLMTDADAHEVVVRAPGRASGSVDVIGVITEVELVAVSRADARLMS